jgi:hypothetical protein
VKTQIVVVEEVYGGLDTYLTLACADGELIYLAFEDRALGRVLAGMARCHNSAKRRTIRDSLADIDARSRAGMDAQS